MIGAGKTGVLQQAWDMWYVSDDLTSVLFFFNVHTRGIELLTQKYVTILFKDYDNFEQVYENIICLTTLEPQLSTL